MRLQKDGWAFPPAVKGRFLRRDRLFWSLGFVDGLWILREAALALVALVQEVRLCVFKRMNGRFLLPSTDGFAEGSSVLVTEFCK